MKKLIQSFAIIIALFSLLLTACNPKEIIIPELNITGNNELTITDEGGSSTLSFYGVWRPSQTSIMIGGVLGSMLRPVSQYIYRL